MKSFTSLDEHHDTQFCPTESARPGVLGGRIVAVDEICGSFSPNRDEYVISFNLLCNRVRIVRQKSRVK
jgi:hypothetical protein